MKQKTNAKLITAVFLIGLFLLWTILVSRLDVQTVIATNSKVGLATLNKFIHSMTGTNMLLYTVTDILGLVPFAFMAFFGFVGLTQWIKRKHLLRVDSDILMLGVFYIILIAVYLFFEIFVINYRPILIDGRLEASYPSSTTLLVLCVIPSSATIIGSRIKNASIQKIISFLLYTFTVFMVLARFFSGVHWVTDIIGGILLSMGLVTLLRTFVQGKNKK